MSLELMLRHALRGRLGACSRRLSVVSHGSPFSWRAVSCALALLALTSTAPLAATVEVRPLVSADDAEESATGGMYVNSSDLEMVQDASAQVVGIRWPGVLIPSGATITSAWVQFAAEESQSEVTTLTFRAQAADNAPAFTTASRNISLRTLGPALAAWSPAAWTVGQAGAAQRSPELADLIREVVSRPGWASGNAIVLVISGSGKRTAHSNDGNATLAPLLHVEYTTGTGPPPNAAPVASISVTLAASPPLTVNASGAGSTDADAFPIASYRFDFGDGTAPVVTTAPTSSTTHTYAAAGTYNVTLLVTDTGGLTSLPASASVTVSGGTSGGTTTTVEQRPLASTDDAEESATGTMKLSSSDLELVQDGSTQIVGMRWPALAIPRNATITAAWVQFAARQSHSVTTQLAFSAQAADNAAAFATTTSNVSARPRTTAAVSWTPDAWVAGGAGAAQRTPDLSPLIREVVNRGGWASGNALAMIVTGTGRRSAWSRDGNQAIAPLLHVEYNTSGAPPPNVAPVARLTVTQLASPPLTVSASGATSTDTDAMPIASYRFTFGDGTAAVVTTAPTAVATHTYAATGTYTVTLTATDTGGLTSAPVTAQITVTTGSGSPLAVYAGYYSTHHPDSPQPKPNPWMGSSGVVFVGTPDSPSGGWDTSAIRLDNLTSSSITVNVTVDIGSDRFALWGSRTIPAGQKLILAQTGFENFDGSDLNPAGCYGCNPDLCLTAVQSTVPVVRVTINGTTTNYFDTGQILNTNGVDAAGCPPTDGRLDESQDWLRIFNSSGSAPAAMSELTTDPGTTRAGAMWLARPYPNPVRDELSLRFSTPRRGLVNLTVYDVAGRLVSTALDNELEAGEYIKLIPVRGMMAGRYFARLRTPEGELHQTFVVTR